MAKLILKYKICLLFLFIFYPLQLELFPQTGKLVFEHYSVNQGMSAPVVFTMLQDKNGFLWFGTANGVDKYDGYSFTTYKFKWENSTVNINSLLTRYTKINPAISGQGL